MNKQTFRRADILRTIEDLQIQGHAHLQAQTRINHEKAKLSDAYHIKRKELEWGEHAKALEDIQAEIDEWAEKLGSVEK